MTDRGLRRFVPEIDPDVRRAKRLEVDVRRPPQLGARVPAFVVQIVLGALCAVLSVIQLPGAFWITVGILLSILSGLFPRSHAGWLVIILLGLSEGLRGIGGLEWRFLVLLAGLHAIAVLGSLAVALPSRGILQLAVLARPALRFCVVQIVVQAAAVIVLAVTSPGGRGWHPGAPVLALAGAIGFAALALLSIAPLLRGQPGR